MMRNAIFTVAIVQFFLIWNDLLIALTFGGEATPPHHPGRPAELLGRVRGDQLRAAVRRDLHHASGGILILYLFLNQQIMKGLAAGAVKG